MTHYTAQQLADFPWIVSTDTLRPDHLADAYLGAFDSLGQDVPEPFRSDLQQCAAYASDPIGPASCDPWDVALEWAYDRLNELAPVGFYFGGSEGDGACIGFWLNQEWADLLEHCGWAADSDPGAVASVIRDLVLDGIDTENYEDAYCGQADGCTEERAGADYAQCLFEDSGLQDASLGGWPFHCIDWEAAWRELEVGDGYRLHPISGTDWVVFRSV